MCKTFVGHSTPFLGPLGMRGGDKAPDLTEVEEEGLGAAEQL